MGKIKHRTSMQDIADRLGLHRATISLALRDDPSIPEVTRQRVKDQAAALGYIKNPYVSAWMQQVRSLESAHMGASLALLKCEYGPSETRAVIYNLLLDAARHQAKSLGFSITELTIPPNETSTASIQRILRARGISGVLIFDPLALLNRRQIDFLERDFATVVLLRCGVVGLYNCVTVDLAHNMIVLLDALEHRGFRRIGLVLPAKTTKPGINRLVVPQYLYWQYNRPVNACLPLLPCVDDYRDEDLRQWLELHRPDVVIVCRPPNLEQLRKIGIKAPADLSVALMGTEIETEYSGICNNIGEVGKTAVSFLAQEINLNHFGLPRAPVSVFIPGRWADGATVCPVENGKPQTTF